MHSSRIMITPRLVLLAAVAGGWAADRAVAQNFDGPPRLGVSGKDNYGVGIVVTEVIPDSVATQVTLRGSEDRIPIEEGDLILFYDNQLIQSYDSFFKYVRSLPSGSVLWIAGLRGPNWQEPFEGRVYIGVPPVEEQIRIGAAPPGDDGGRKFMIRHPAPPDVEPPWVAQPGEFGPVAGDRLGVTAANFGVGVKLATIDKNGPASRLNRLVFFQNGQWVQPQNRSLSPSDLIVTANDQPIYGLDDLRRAISHVPPGNMIKLVGLSMEHDWRLPFEAHAVLDDVRKPIDLEDAGRPEKESEGPRPAYPTDLNDEQWGQVQALLEAVEADRAEGVNMRDVVNTLRYQARTNCDWDMLPHDLLAGEQVARLRDNWRESGLWQRIVATIQQTGP